MTKRTINYDTLIPFTVTELLRLRRWYQVLCLQDEIALSADDIILDAKLRAARYAVQDESDARAHAVTAAQDRQYFGPERRNRASAPAVRPRIVRAVPRMAVCN